MDGLKGVQKCIDAALESNLPESGEYHYYKNFPAFKQPLSESMDRIKSLLVNCQSLAATSKGASPAPAAGAEPDWGDEPEVFDWVTALLDDALEGVSSCLDAHRQHVRLLESGGDAVAAGLAAALPSQAAQVAGPNAAARGWRQSGPVRHAARLARPQGAFEEAVDNSNTPFRWLHVINRLMEGRVLPRLFVGRAQALMVQCGMYRNLIPAARHKVQGKDGTMSAAAGGTQHPMAAELSMLRYEPWQLEAPEPQPPRPLDDTPLVWVDSLPALEDMVVHLRGARHIAMDLENHSYRSFQGFTCVVQLSTRERDFVVDALALRSVLGPALAPVLSDPAIVKVLHGADHDVEWLQRDFGLFLVNMFDTGQAARVLLYPSLGLAYLLEHFCNIKADKRYQLADWRVRPLGADMLHYARTDTHYLLYIHDCLKQELAKPCLQVPDALREPLPPGVPDTPLATVLERSRQLCLRTYQKELFTDDAYLEALDRWGVALNPVQQHVFAALFAWRDAVCREEDESTGYVLPRAQLVMLAQNMPGTVKDMQRMLGRNASELVLRRAAEVVDAILTAKQGPPPQLQPLVTPVPPPQLLVPPAAQQAGGPAAGNGRPQGSSATAPAPSPVSPVAISLGAAALPSPAAAPIVPKSIAPVFAKVGGGLFGGKAFIAKQVTQISSRSASGTSGSMFAVAATTAVSVQASLAAPAAPAAPAAAPVAPAAPRSATAAAVAAEPAVGMQDDAVAQHSQAGTGAAGSALMPAAARAGGEAGPASANMDTQQGTAHVAVPTEQPAMALDMSDQRQDQPDQADVLNAAIVSANIEKAQVPEALHCGSSTSNVASSSAAVKVGSAPAGSVFGALLGKRTTTAALPAPVAAAAAADDHSEDTDRVKRLKGSFVLPWAFAPAPAADDAGSKQQVIQQDGAAAAEPTEMEDCDDGPVPASAQDVRSVMDQLIGSRSRDIIIDRHQPDGAGQADAEAQEEPGSSSAGGSVPGDGPGASGAAKGRQGWRVQGSELGLDLLEFVPVPLKAQKGPKLKQGDITLRDPAQGRGIKAQLKDKYVLGLTSPDGQEEEEHLSSSSDSDLDISGGGIFSSSNTKRGRKQGPQSQARAATADSRAPAVVPFDYASHRQRHNQNGGAAARAGTPGRARPGGNDAQEEDFPRGRRPGGQGGRRGQGRGAGHVGRWGGQEGGGRERGGKDTVFRPYDIPDSSLIKGGKRSTVQPRSGNRNFTFK